MSNERPLSAEKIVCEESGECLAYITPNRTGKDVECTYFFVYKDVKSGPFFYKDAVIEIPKDKFISTADHFDDTETIYLEELCQN